MSLKPEETLRYIGFLVIFLLVLNIVLFAMKVITQFLFWLIILLGALFVYQWLPKLKKRLFS